MAKSKKSKSGAKPSVNVRDMKAKKDPKGGAFLKLDSQSLKLKQVNPTIDTTNINFKKY
ncbi:MAG: hypothetical protein ACXVJT_06695 [Thermoanaerobaculia bacterium]